MTFLQRIAASTLAALLAVSAAPPSFAGISDRPGDFDYYALVLSWSPSFCLSGNGSHEGDPQCSITRPYAFVLHGLWPQYDKGWPESCDTGGDARLPPAMVQSMLDIMPSEKLVGHEYEKHGTCSGLDAQGYLGLARKLYTSINVPPKYVNLTSPLQVPLADLRRDLIAANPQLTPDEIAVNCDKNGRLVEVHFCFTKDGKPKACGRNEIQAKMCRQDLVSLPPVRGHITSAAAAPAAAPASVAAPNSDTAANDNTDPNAVDTGTSDNATSNRHRHRHRHHHSYSNF